MLSYFLAIKHSHTIGPRHQYSCMSSAKAPSALVLFTQQDDAGHQLTEMATFAHPLGLIGCSWLFQSVLFFFNDGTGWYRSVKILLLKKTTRGTF
jgi:hypothetical protein